MSMKQSNRLNSTAGKQLPAGYSVGGAPSEALSGTESVPTQDSADSTAKAVAKSGSKLANHKGKLAVGAAAMLGLAVFYKWREGRLAKDDPEEYARLQRLKAAVDTDESQPPGRR